MLLISWFFFKLKKCTTNFGWIYLIHEAVIKDSFDKTQLTHSEILSFPVWVNSHIKVNTNSVFIKNSIIKV